MIPPLVALWVHLSWILGFEVSFWHVPVGLLSSLLFLSYLERTPIYKLWKVFLVGLILLGLALLWSKSRYDLSWDGPGYHQEAIIQLESGHNPVYDHLVEDQNSSFIWVNAYPKGTWAFSTAVYALTQSIESGKIYHLIGFFSLALLSVFFIHQLLPTINRYLKWLLIIGLIANPILWVQVNSYYVDGVLFSYLMLLLMYQYLHFKNCIDERYLIGIGLLAVFIPFIKYSGFLIGGLAVLLFTGHYWKQFKAKGIFSTKLLLLALITGLIFSAASLIPNTLYHHNPVHPIGTIDLVEWQAPKNIVDKPYLLQWWISFHSKSSQSGWNQESELKWPFSLDFNAEFDPFRFAWIQTAGWGPLTSGLVWLSLILALIHLRSLELRWTVGLFLLFLLLGTAFMTGSWMARYFSWWHTLPMVVAFALLYKKSPLWTRALLAIILSLVIVQTAYLVFVNFNYQFLREAAINKQWTRWKEAGSDTLHFVFYRDSFHARNSTRVRYQELGFYLKDDTLAVQQAEKKETIISSRNSGFVVFDGLKKATLSDFDRFILSTPEYFMDDSWYLDDQGSRKGWFENFQAGVPLEQDAWHRYHVWPHWNEFKAAEGLY